MPAAIRPPNEAQRLRALHALGLIDSPPEQDFDDIAALAAECCGMSIGLVCFVDDERQWFKAAAGTSIRQTLRDAGFCAHAILTPGEVFIVEDAAADPRFAECELVTCSPDIRSYAGAPLVLSTGEALGTLCVMDPEPHRIDDSTRRRLLTLARQVVALLELRRRTAEIERANKSLRRSEQRNARVLATALDAVIVMDEHGVVRGWNPRAEELFGWIAGEVLGRPLRDIIIPHRLQAAHLAGLRRYLATGVASVVGQRIETSALRRDGTEIDIELAITALETDDSVEFSAFLRDISEPKRFEHEREENEWRQRLFTDSMQRLAKAVASQKDDPDLALRAVTEAAAETLGVERASVWLYNKERRSIRCSDLYLRSDDSHSRGMMLLEDDFPRYFKALREEEIIAANDALGDLRTVELVEPYLLREGIKSMLDVPIWSNGALAGVLCHEHIGDPRRWTADEEAFATAVASLVTVVLEMGRRQRVEIALEHALDDAEAANRAKSAFLANMSHEIRTPMTSIVGYAELLLEPGLDVEERNNCIQTIRRNGSHLLGIINDILDITRIEVGGMIVEEIACNPVQIVCDVAGVMRPKALEKGISFVIDFDGPQPESIQSDPLRLRQILINIVDNAIKFTSRGEVRLVVRCEPCGDDSESPGTAEARMRFDVIDSGLGLSKDAIPRLFQPFVQVDPSTTRLHGGTGLGLAISRRLAQMLGGDVAASSAPGAGSTFTCTIRCGSLAGVPMRTGVTEGAVQASNAAAPRNARSGEQPNCPTIGAAERLTPPLNGVRVLLAEDGPDNQRLIMHMLRRAGAEVSLAVNGRDAVEQAKVDEFDLVLMDMQMPVMDGYEATCELRRNGYEGPIIALTAHAMEGDRERCLDAGCDEYASKPIDRTRLIDLARFFAAASRPAA